MLENKEFNMYSNRRVVKGDKMSRTLSQSFKKSII